MIAVWADFFYFRKIFFISVIFMLPKKRKPQAKQATTVKRLFLFLLQLVDDLMEIDRLTCHFWTTMTKWIQVQRIWGIRPRILPLVARKEFLVQIRTTRSRPTAALQRYSQSLTVPGLSMILVVLFHHSTVPTVKPSMGEQPLGVVPTRSLFWERPVTKEPAALWIALLKYTWTYSILWRKYNMKNVYIN